MERLKKLVLMSKYNALPYNIVQGMVLYLELLEDFLHNFERNLKVSFRILNCSARRLQSGGGCAPETQWT